MFFRLHSWATISHLEQPHNRSWQALRRRCTRALLSSQVSGGLIVYTRVSVSSVLKCTRSRAPPGRTTSPINNAAPRMASDHLELALAASLGEDVPIRSGILRAESVCLRRRAFVSDRRSDRRRPWRRIVRPRFIGLGPYEPRRAVTLVVVVANALQRGQAGRPNENGFR